MKHQKSFTLIELLVVIAIIGLLSSIVVVNVNSAREKAKKARALQFSQSLYNALGAEAVGYWAFDNNVQDLSGNGNNGTWQGASSYSTTDKILGAAAGQFDGSKYVNVGNNVSLSMTSAFTVEAWINSNVVGPGAGGTVFSRYGSSNGYELRFEGYGNGRMMVDIVVNGNWIVAQDVNNIINATGKWYHVAGTYNGNYLKLYIDGVFQSQTLATTPPALVTANAIIGRRTSLDGTPHVFNGLIDEVRVYSRALTSAEIQKHYVEGLLKHLAEK